MAKRWQDRAFSAGVVASAAMAAANLLAGLSGGLARLGWDVGQAALQHHGAVMVCGFFGTLISLERAVALRRGPGLLAPLAAGGGGLLLWAAGRPDLAAIAWLLAAAALVALYALAGQTRAWSLHLRVELAAALAWAGGTLAWTQLALPAATLGWMAFLVGTIAGERRELMQFVRLPRWARRGFVMLVAGGAAAVALAIAGAAADLPVAVDRLAAALWWAACAALALWLLRWDIAPRQWRREAWLGHTGQCLTVGYVWLLAAAALGLGRAAGALDAGGAAAVAPHAVLLGFVFAMVFGHAPIILPALARIRPRYTGWARLPLWLLSASLLLRLAAAATGQPPWLAAAGALHAAAIAGFAAVMAIAVLRAPRPAPPRQ
ncbi:MAG: hypothetical protein JNL87_05850 [Burkholderiaceae bacterium]|nr:hypothetical protein [Burkholderiaceae bacterium]